MIKIDKNVGNISCRDFCKMAGIVVVGAAFYNLHSDDEVQAQKQINGGVDEEKNHEANDIEARQELEQLYHDMWQAMLKKDIATLDAMHDEEFVLVHMTGMRQPKEEFLRAIRDGDLNYFTEKTEYVHIEVNGDKALLTGQSRVEAAVFGGSRNTWPLQLDFEAEKRNGRWMLLFAKASTY